MLPSEADVPGSRLSPKHIGFYNGRLKKRKTYLGMDSPKGERSMSTIKLAQPLPDQLLRSYRIPDVADRLGVSPRTVARMIDAGELKTVRPRTRGRVVQVTAASLNELFGGH